MLADAPHSTQRFSARENVHDASQAPHSGPVFPSAQSKSAAESSHSDAFRTYGKASYAAVIDEAEKVEEEEEEEEEDDEDEDEDKKSSLM